MCIVKRSYHFQLNSSCLKVYEKQLLTANADIFFKDFESRLPEFAAVDFKSYFSESESPVESTVVKVEYSWGAEYFKTLIFYAEFRYSATCAFEVNLTEGLWDVAHFKTIWI